MDIEKEKLKRLIQWSEGVPQPPVSLHLELTRRCNLDCISCWREVDKFPAHQELQKDELLNLCHQAKDLGVLEWNLIGGEPMLRGELTLELIREITLSGMEADLTTNATLFLPEWIVRLVDYKLRLLRVSIDCPDPEGHDRLRGSKGAFEKAFNALKLLKEEKERQKSTLPAVEIFTVLSSFNYHRLSEMVELAGETGAWRITVQPANIFSERGKILIMDEKMRQEFHQELEKSLKIARKYRLDTLLPALFEEQLLSEVNDIRGILGKDVEEIEDEFYKIPCYDPWIFMAIRPDGSCGPCCRFEDIKGEITLSPENIRFNSLSEIWMGKYFNFIRQGLKNNKIPAFCAGCCITQVIRSRQIRADMYKFAGKWDRALRIYDKILRENPKNEWIWVLRGSALNKLKRYQEAELSLKKALDLDNEDLWAWYHLGDCYYLWKKYEKGLKCFEKIISHSSPKDRIYPSALAGMGLIYRSLRDYEKAILFFNQAMECGLKSPEIYRMRDRCLKKANSFWRRLFIKKR